MKNFVISIFFLLLAQSAFAVTYTETFNYTVIADPSCWTDLPAAQPCGQPNTTIATYYRFEPHVGYCNTGQTYTKIDYYTCKVVPDPPPCTPSYEWVLPPADGSIPLNGQMQPAQSLDGVYCKQTNCSNEYVGVASCAIARHPTLTDGVQTPGTSETGIDCGGESNIICIPYCPDGTTYESTFNQCYTSANPDSIGNCPPGFTRIKNPTTGAIICDYSVDAVMATPNIWDPNSSNQNYSPFTFDSTVNTPPAGTFSTVDTNQNTTTTTNTTTAPPDTVLPDGTTAPSGTTVVSNSTTTTTTNSAGGTSTTTTTVNNYYGPTGESLGSDTSETFELPPEENPDNYDYQTSPGDFSDAVISPDDLPEEIDITDSFSNFISNNQINDLVSSVSLTTSSPLCSLSTNLFNKTVEFSICDYQSTFNGMGYVLIFISIVTGFFILIGRGN